MTWFRVGGAGIPASLKNGMNSVLNKKFGTTGQNYPPNGWPDDVNLLGPLPIVISNKAPIVSFTDGADDVPISSGTFYIAPSQSGTGTPSPNNPRPIVGYTGMTINLTGKNLLKWSDFSDYSNWKTDVTANQSYPTSSTNRGYVLDLPVGTYTLSFGIDAETFPTYLYLCKDDGTSSTRLIYFTGGAYSTDHGTFSVDGTSKYYFSIGSAGTQANFEAQMAKISFAMLEVGSSASTYEAYKAKTPIVDAFGRTIYGGERKTDGTLKSTMPETPVELNTLTWTPTTIGGHACFFANLPNGMIKSGGTNILDGLCSTYAITAVEHPDNKTIRLYSNDSFNFSRVSIRDDDYASATGAEFKASVTGQIVYELKTSSQSEYSLSPISLSTYYGDNNVWCDTGDTQIDYRADIALALASLQGSRSLSASLMRSASPEEVSEPEENIQNPEETEGESNER